MKKKIFIGLVILTIIGWFILEYRYLGTNFSIDRFIILSFTSTFFYLHFILNVNKMYDFIYRKRYIIGGALLIIIVCLGYNQSSLIVWDDLIQPNIKVGQDSLILGIPRIIRGDEFIVSTMSIFSQSFNNFSDVSSILMARSGLVTMFPFLPCYNLAMIVHLLYIPFLFLPMVNAFSFLWFAQLIALILVNFELCMLVTKKNKLYSLLGTMLISLAPALVWWTGTGIALYVFGPLAVLILNAFLKEKRFVVNVIYSILMAIVGLNYIFVMYPAWQIPYGYVFLGFFIWIIFENKKYLNWNQLIYAFIVLIIIGLVSYNIISESYSIYLLTINTVYPGTRFSLGGTGSEKLFDYFINIFFPYKPFFNPSEYSNFLSFFPLPILLGVQKIFSKKEKKKDLFMVIFIILAIFLGIFCYFKLPSFLVKITFLSHSTSERCLLIIGYICIFLLLRYLTLYENNKKITKKKLLLCITVASLISILGIVINNYYLDEFIGKKMMIAMFIIFGSLMTLICLNNKKTNKYLAISLIIISLYVGGTINPIVKGLDAIYEKPIAKEIQKVVKVEPDARWLVVHSNYAVPNFLIANGARTVNSTNYYPNFDFWNKLDKNKEYENVYNRYAHIRVIFTTEKTSIELGSLDLVMLYLNPNDLNSLNIDYICSQEDISTFSNNQVTFEEIYNEDNTYIYKVIE